MSRPPKYHRYTTRPPLSRLRAPLPLALAWVLGFVVLATLASPVTLAYAAWRKRTRPPLDGARADHGYLEEAA